MVSLSASALEQHPAFCLPSRSCGFRCETPLGEHFEMATVREMFDEMSLNVTAFLEVPLPVHDSILLPASNSRRV